MQEKEEIEQAHLLEYQEFNKNWDDNMTQSQEQHEEVLRALEERHVRELEENRANLENTLPLHPKASAEQLNMTKIQE